jgi:hypothetical protein
MLKRIPLPALLLLLLATAPALAQPAQAPLTNNDVLELHRAGLSAEVIVAKINSAPRAFDTSVAALRELKQAGVPEAVILAMIGAAKPEAPPAPAPTPHAALPPAREALKALRRLATAAEVGVSYEAYFPLLASVKAEFDGAIEAVPPSDFRNEAVRAMREYELVGRVWSLTWKGDGIDPKSELGRLLIEQYKIPVWGRAWWKFLSGDDVLPTVWRAARGRFDRAAELLQGADPFAFTPPPPYTTGAGGRFERAGISFDVPPGWKLKDNGSTEAPFLSLSYDGGGEALITMICPLFPADSERGRKARRHLTTDYLESLKKTMESLGSKKVERSPVHAEIAGASVEGVRLTGAKKNGEPAYTENYLVVINNRMVSLTFFSTLSTSGTGPGWEAVRTSLNLGP